MRRFADRLRAGRHVVNPAQRKAYVNLSVSKVEVGQETIRIAGSEPALMGALADATRPSCRFAH